MPMSEMKRQNVIEQLTETIGEEAAEALMESIPPFDWHQIATKDDLTRALQALTTEVNGQFAMVAAEFVGVRGELAKVEGYLAKEIAENSKEIAELSKEIAEQSKEIAKLDNKMANQTRVIVLTVVALISPLYLLLGASALS